MLAIEGKGRRSTSGLGAGLNTVTALTWRSVDVTSKTERIPHLKLIVRDLFEVDVVSAHLLTNAG